MQNPSTFTPFEALDGGSTVHKKSANGHDAIPRRRNPLACEMCYKKKIRCEVEGSNQACIQCTRRNIRCKFTTRKEKKECIKRTQYVRDLEERVRKTESLLKAAGILNEETISQDEISDDYHVDDDDDDDEDEYGDEDELLDGEDSGIDEDEQEYGIAPGLGRNSSEFGPQTRLNTSRNRKSAPRSVAVKSHRYSSGSVDSSASSKDPLPGENDLQQVPICKANDREDSRYYGRSSFLSILSREGVEWIKNKTGDVKFLSLLFSDSSHDSPWDYWRPDVFHDLFASKVFKPLPPRAEVFSLLRDYFRTVNRLFPVYHEGSFMQLVEWQYTQQTCNDAARWASINIILSLAYEYRFSNSLKPEKDREKAWFYFKNAVSVFSELTMRRTDLLSVQALLGMALFLRGNSGTQSALPIVTAAIRSCHRMGLHRKLARPYLPEVEQEQRKRVFWVAYILDQSTCVRTGNAPAQHPDDFDIELPVIGPDEGCAMGDTTSFFRQLCRLTIIKSRIYYKLYSTKALHNKSPIELIQIIEELHAELDEWRSSSPFDIVKQKAAGQDFLLGFAAVGLQFVYYNALIMIHRLPLILNFAYAMHLSSGHESHFDPRMISKQSYVSAGICVQAARDTLRLVNNMPWGDIAWIWSLLYYVFLAVVTIFVAILRDSKHPHTREDLQSLNMASTFFATLIPGEGPCNYATFMMNMCANFERIARAVLERDGRPITQASIEHSRRSSIDRVPRKLSSRSHTNTNATRTATTAKQEGSQTSSSSPTHSTSGPFGLDIPYLEGLPNISSTGYFVPESPGTTPEDLNLTNTPFLANPFQTTATTTAAAAAAAASPETSLANPTQNISRPYNTYTSNNNNNNNPPSYSNIDIFSQQPTSATNFSPTTAADSNNNNNTNTNNTIPTPPELWQIPLTADWELGGGWLNGLFGNGFLGQPFPSMPASMMPDMMGFGGPGSFGGGPNQDQSQDQQGPGQDCGVGGGVDSSMWGDGFLGSF